MNGGCFEVDWCVAVCDERRHSYLEEEEAVREEEGGVFISVVE